MYMMTRLFSLLLSLVAALAAVAAPVRDQHVEVELVAEPVAIVPGRTFWAGVRVAHDEHWHTYWLNPGDSGLRTKIAWNLPEGFTAGDIVWPTPSRIPAGPLVSYGFEGEILLMVPITPPASIDATEVTLAAKVSWLMCKEACIPGKATVSLTLPVHADGGTTTPAPLFESARRLVPAVDDAWTFTATREGATFVLRAANGKGWDRPVDGVVFFPEREDIINPSAPQTVEPTETGFVLRVEASPLLEDLPETVVGIVTHPEGWLPGGLQPGLAVAATSAPSSTASVPGSAPARMGFLAALGFAFLGGMILNLMPCVFPVLSIKVLGFVEQAGESRGKLLTHGLVFAAGVLACFWALAGTLIALRAGGAGIGWGFQLQSPLIVGGLAALFFLLGLSLFGVFEMGLSLTGTGSGLQSRGGYGGSFFSGLLATIVATPCTAPFMGAALGYALTLSAPAALAIFTSLGAGMAFPYVALSASPALLRRIPRPGAWMESLKQFMGFLMMATVVWLLWVLGQQVGVDGLTVALATLVVLGIAAWIAGRWGALHRPPATRIAARILAAVLIAAGLAGAVPTIRSARPAAATGTTTTAGGIEWKAYDPIAVEALRADGKPVFIDFTAAWCLTCQVNKRVALHHPQVENAFREAGIATFKADWTDHDETITQALASFGRSGVPLYVLYGRDRTLPATLLPEVLTPGLVIDAIARMR